MMLCQLLTVVTESCKVHRRLITCFNPLWTWIDPIGICVRSQYSKSLMPLSKLLQWRRGTQLWLSKRNGSRIYLSFCLCGSIFVITMSPPPMSSRNFWWLLGMEDMFLSKSSRFELLLELQTTLSWVTAEVDWKTKRETLMKNRVPFPPPSFFIWMLTFGIADLVIVKFLGLRASRYS